MNWSFTPCKMWIVVLRRDIVIVQKIPKSLMYVIPPLTFIRLHSLLLTSRKPWRLKGTWEEVLYPLTSWVAPSVETPNPPNGPGSGCVSFPDPHLRDQLLGALPEQGPSHPKTGWPPFGWRSKANRGKLTIFGVAGLHAWHPHPERAKGCNMFVPVRYENCNTQALGWSLSPKT